MPIYEFRCTQCNDCFEVLVLAREEEMVARCPKCGSEEFERVMSRAAVIGGASAPSGESATCRTRSCSAGSCTTWDLPGHTR